VQLTAETAPRSLANVNISHSMLAPVSFTSQLTYAIHGVEVDTFGPIVLSVKCTNAPDVRPPVGMSASSWYDTLPPYTPGGPVHDISIVDESVRLSAEVSLMGTAGMYPCAGAAQSEREREEKIRLEIEGRAKRDWREGLRVVGRMMKTEGCAGR